MSETNTDKGGMGMQTIGIAGLLIGSVILLLLIFGANYIHENYPEWL